MIFLYRFLKHLFTFLCVILPLQLLGAIVLLVYLPVHRRIREFKVGNSQQKTMRLPYLLRWFDNVDIYPDVFRDFSVYYQVFIGSFWNHYIWLAWRNPLNYFGYMILGEINDLHRPIKDDNIGDGTNQKPGIRIIEEEINDNTLYEYYYIKKWSSTKCLRVRIGWKMAGKHPGQFLQWVFVISPWHSYDGE